MMLSRSLAVPATALLASLFCTPALAQLYTDCNPLNATCDADPALGTAHTFIFNSSPPTGTFKNTAGTVDYTADTGAGFTVSKKGESPTIISNFYFFWGRTEVIMRAATGTGIISSIVWSSDVLDEVDWEFMGGNITHAETNYFGKGRQDFQNAIYYPVDGGDVQNDWHNYTNVWTNESLKWYIDGSLVRTLLPAQANNSDNYPQTPMKLSLGIWAGGDSEQPQGTIDWAGGVTNYDDGPFTMYVKSARVEDFSSGKEYSYGDNSGDWTSIKIATGNSTAVDAINTKPESADAGSVSEKWEGLSSSAKSGVYAGAAGVGAVMIAALFFYYFRQRRRGQREAALAAQRMEQDRLELERFKKEGRDPDALGYEGAEYDAATMGKSANVNTAVYSMPGNGSDNDSRSNSLQSAHGMPEAAAGWDATGSNMHSPMPLIQNNGPARNNSFGPFSQSPGMPNSFPPPTSPPNGSRSFSSPGAQMRMGSPGPQNGGYQSLDHVQSPTMMQPENRSFSAPRAPGGGYGGGDGYFDGNGNGNGYR
ncbi:concanavalin A-like lectin/glucanase domain-containing protein [Pseudomassariella vexata]|uniref:chitinase n=1 Tax=Pseudomassariella vexata TaxID=1141098 RepID=A0A1Y2E8E2_9PEZI|nr:concanavalin A-like lectin/glucanase domain-containing protein [Pseudomassariella vexata]ORY67820.1 concanavalin A-like lectin/glucanase domain-containing protein [Pseudomassariella vexata]